MSLTPREASVFVAILAIVLTTSVFHDCTNKIICLIASSIVSWLTYDIIKRARSFQDKINVTNPKNKAVLITGCDSGFGNSLALKCAERGFLVFATCLDDQSPGAIKLKSKNLLGEIVVLKMDVTSDSDVEKTLVTVKRKIGSRVFWGLVNNAGFIRYNYIEFGPLDDYLKQFNVNAVGAVRVTRAFLPLLRKVDNSRIINVGSVAGRFNNFGTSGYSMSKHALRAFNDGLRREMLKWNVQVTLIEPFAFTTNMVDRRLINTQNSQQTGFFEADEAVLRDYGQKSIEEMDSLLQEFFGMANSDPEIVVDTLLYTLTTTNHLETHYRVGKFGEKVFMFLNDVLPEFMFDAISADKAIRRTGLFLKKYLNM